EKRKGEKREKKTRAKRRKRESEKRGKKTSARQKKRKSEKRVKKPSAKPKKRKSEKHAKKPSAKPRKRKSVRKHSCVRPCRQQVERLRASRAVPPAETKPAEVAMTATRLACVAASSRASS